LSKKHPFYTDNKPLKIKALHVKVSFQLSRCKKVIKNPWGLRVGNPKKKYFLIRISMQKSLCIFAAAILAVFEAKFKPISKVIKSDYKKYATMSKRNISKPSKKEEEKTKTWVLENVWRFCPKWLRKVFC